MKKTFHAQSTLELIMVIILVLAGIFVMGPYVIRSVNAYMHSWELSVDQANSNPNVALDSSEVPGGVPPPSPTCEDFEGSSSDCEMNNGSLVCTWVERWFSNSDPNEPCFKIEDCVETANLEAGTDCQNNWQPGMECCWSDPGCAQCPH
jgi:hypothetical protein